MVRLSLPRGIEMIRSPAGIRLSSIVETEKIVGWDVGRVFAAVRRSRLGQSVPTRRSGDVGGARLCGRRSAAGPMASIADEGKTPNGGFS